MKKLLLASVGFIALGTVSASAADLPRREVMPAKAPVYVSQAYNWTGGYVGLYGGGGWGHSDFSGPLASGNFGMSGGVLGATLGYNYQIGQTVLGLEEDIGWSNIRGSSSCGATTCDTRNNWMATERLRLGYAVDRFMPYVTGGLAFGDVKTSAAGIGDAHQTKVGWTAGAGLEAAISGPWTAKIEYLYVDLGHADSVLSSQASFRTNIVRAGLNYRF